MSVCVLSFLVMKYILRILINVHGDQNHSDIEQFLYISHIFNFDFLCVCVFFLNHTAKSYRNLMTTRLFLKRHAKGSHQVMSLFSRLTAGCIRTLISREILKISLNKNLKWQDELVNIVQVYSSCKYIKLQRSCECNNRHFHLQI